MAIKKQLKEHRTHKKFRENQANLKEALEHIHELSAHVEAIKRLGSTRNPLPIKTRHGTNTSEATAIAVLSDVHMGEKFSREQVNEQNEYSVAICKQRCARFFDRVVRLTNKERQDVTIDELILFLGGDLIDGALHLDTIMANEIAEPMKQAVEMQNVLEGGLTHLIKTGNYKRITVVCADGNHGRVTHKMHHASRQGNALEYYLYFNLAARFPELNWYIKESLLTYVPVYDNVIRFMHGDRIAFGGVNGFYTYLHRKLYEWETSVRADYTILGHLHQYTPTRRYLVNGSVPGYNPFAISLGARMEPPIQGFLLWDKKRGPTVHIPVLLAGGD